MAKSTQSFSTDLLRLDEIDRQRTALDAETASIQARLIAAARDKAEREKMETAARIGDRLRTLFSFVKA